MHEPSESVQPPPQSPAVGQAERECDSCGQFQILPSLADGETAGCCRCGAAFSTPRGRTQRWALACCVGALVLFVFALQLPFLDLWSLGHLYQATLFTGPEALGERGMWEVGLAVLVVLVLLPAVRLVLLVTVLLRVQAPHPPRYLAWLFGWSERLRPWSMVEVFLLGVFVAYTRLQAIADVQVGPALLALIGVMLCMVAADAELDHQSVWDRLDPALPAPKPAADANHPRIACVCCHLVVRARALTRCPRCGTRLRRRKRQSLVRASALLAAAAVLYIPANVYPVMTVIRFGSGEPNTIMSGVIELLQARMIPLALLVFLASLVVPMAKLFGLGSMLLMTSVHSNAHLLGRTRLYRFIHGIGRWSMIDVFMICILTGLVRMGFVATVLPGGGAVAFAAVVVLTMFASEAFDPRLMWDAAATGRDLDLPAKATHSGSLPA